MRTIDLEVPWKRESWAESLTDDNDPAVEGYPDSLLVTGAAIVAGMATNKILQATWKQTRGTEPPLNPAAAGVSWRDALIWAATVGASIGVSRVLARRSMTSVLR